MKIKCFLLLITLLLMIPGVGFSQITYQKTYGDLIGDNTRTLIQTSDGGFIMAGSTGNFGAAGYADCYIIKTNFYGDTLWTKTYGTGERDYPNSIQQTSDGGYIIAGFIQNNSTLQTEIFLIKTDSVGHIHWNKIYNPGSISSHASSILQTYDGGYVVTGSIYDGINIDAYLFKTDSIGNLLWRKKYGGTDEDQGYSLQQTFDGGYAIAGRTRSFGTGNYDFYLIKTDSTGLLLWSKTYGGINIDVGVAVQQTSDGGYIIGGYTQSFGAGDIDMYLVKTDLSGNILWSKTFGGTNLDQISYVMQTTDGGYILGGITESFGAGFYDLFLVRTDSNGDTLWTKAIGDTSYDYFSVVQETVDGGYIIAGQTNFDAYLIKTDVNGNSGCHENSTTTIVTSPATQITSPSTTVTNSFISVINSPFNVGSGGIVTTLCTTVGVPPIFNLQSSIFNISPNPFSNQINITGTANELSEIILYDITSRKLLQQTFANSTTINTSQLSKGIYIYEARNINAVIKKGKVVKE